MAPHPTEQMLRDYGSGKLGDADAGGLADHLETCADCRKRVGELAPDSLLKRIRQANDDVAGTRTFKPAAQANAQNLARDTIPPGLADHPDYEIMRELGRGGMGEVYLAHNTLMGRDEVLKVMSKQIIERPGVLDRFLREIRAVAKLRHPNIVTAYSATRLGEIIVFAMEYVEGLDLSKMVKAKGPLPVAHACLFIHQAGLGLQHAHEEGLVHRDIKPGNLMLSRKGDKAMVKVLDFGLAKATREQGIDSALTSEGQALGTPDYIAPEQIIDAQSADIRADIYSLGGTLYYLLTGRPPFQAKSLYDVYESHMSKNANPINLIRPEVPAELAALVARMMAKDPDRRFQTPREVADALTLFFKTAAPAAKRAKAEISNVSPPETPDRAPVPEKTLSEAPPEDRWQSIIGSIDDPENLLKANAEVVATPPARRLWPWIATGVVIIGLLGAWAAGLIGGKSPKPENPLVAQPEPPKTVSPAVVPKPPPDPFPVGSFWKAYVSPTVSSRMFVRERNGEEFLARVFFTNDAMVWDIRGTIGGNRMDYKAGDVTIIHGGLACDGEGTFKGDRIDIHWNVPGGDAGITPWQREIGHGGDDFQPGTSWLLTKSQDCRLTVRTRDGNHFTGTYDVFLANSPQSLAFNGTVYEDRVYWFGSDMTPNGSDEYGIIRGNEIEFFCAWPQMTWKGLFRRE